MIIIIQDKTINSSDIRKLYPAALVKTGHGDEITEISLEWLDTESNEEVEVAGYGIFVTTKDKQKFSFLFDSREELEEEISKISAQF